jgi:NTE family protein
MFGAYQAGVWKALNPVFRPDVVIGCSVGSINGWAIAGGISGDELIKTWLDPRCATLMRRRASRRPWDAFFDPEPLQQMVQELMSTYTPRVPFALAVTEVPRLRLQLVHTPSITWRHLLASCAVPVGYPPVRIDGRCYCDGGLLSVMPVWAAPLLGADRVIAVNVLPNMPLNVLRSCVRTVRLLAPREPRVTGIEVLRIGPGRMLGTLRDAVRWNSATVRSWIERGHDEAQALVNSSRLSSMLGRFV